jgi:hypothetical protein
MNDPFNDFKQKNAAYWDRVRRDNAGSGAMLMSGAVGAAIEPPEASRADDRQVEGSHYKEMPVQPWSVMEAVLTHQEFVGYLKGNVIKYSMRQGLKTAGDAEKAQHYIEKLAEVERGY